MKNNYCDLTRQQINAVPERFKGFFLSPFQFNLRGGMVAVPEDTFKKMIDIIAEYAVATLAAPEDVRNQALEEAANTAENFGPGRPLLTTRPPALIQGRWEGEQAASANISAAIRALKRTSTDQADTDTGSAA